MEMNVVSALLRLKHITRFLADCNDPQRTLGAAGVDNMNSGGVLSKPIG
jgi:hypothetical protein